MPLPTLPDTSIRSTDASCPQGALTSSLPLRTATSSMSTTMPGLVTSVRTPEPTSASMGSNGCVITASVKSSVTAPLLTRISIRRGTSHGPGALHDGGLAVDADEVLGGRGAQHGPGGGREVLRDRGEFGVGARGQRDLEALVEFFGGQPAVTGGHPQLLGHPVPVLVGDAQLIAGDRVGAVPGWLQFARHGHTLWRGPRPG